MIADDFWWLLMSIDEYPVSMIIGNYIDDRWSLMIH